MTETTSTVERSTQDDGFWARWGVWTACAGVFAILVVVWAALTFGLYRAPATPQEGMFPASEAEAVAARGQFGDMFGVANALFSGLAFTALIISLSMQRRELSLQRAELKLTRLEMALAREQATLQATALAEQSRSMEQQTSNELLASQIRITSTLLQVCFESMGKSGVQSAMADAMGGHQLTLLPKYLAKLNALQAQAEQALQQYSADEAKTATGPTR